MATDAPLDDTGNLPQLDLNRPGDIAAFIFDFVMGERPPEGAAADVAEPTPSPAASDDARRQP